MIYFSGYSVTITIQSTLEMHTHPLSIILVSVLTIFFSQVNFFFFSFFVFTKNDSLMNYIILLLDYFFAITIDNFHYVFIHTNTHIYDIGFLIFIYFMQLWSPFSRTFLFELFTLVLHRKTYVLACRYVEQVSREPTIVITRFVSALFFTFSR